MLPAFLPSHSQIGMEVKLVSAMSSQISHKSSQHSAIPDGRLHVLTNIVSSVSWNISPSLLSSTVVCFCHCGNGCNVYLLCWIPQQHGHVLTVIWTSTASGAQPLCGGLCHLVFQHVAKSSIVRRRTQGSSQNGSATTKTVSSNPFQVPSIQSVFGQVRTSSEKTLHGCRPSIHEECCWMALFVHCDLQ